MNDLSILRIPLLLGSASPRRKFLLEEAGFSPRIIPAEIEEFYPDDLHPEAVPEFLANKKAEALLPAIRTGEVIIAADSVVILEGQVLGKPDSAEAAKEMLRLLSGKKHDVITGVSLLNNQKNTSFSVKSEVYFDDLTDGEISYYINEFKPYDKAGSYGIQEWIGWCKIKSIRGSYSNIMGLPVARVYQELQHFVSK
jgi:septum formation protein